MIQLSDQDLLSRLKNFEDNFVERKRSSDKKEWLRTTVAFANSTPVGYPAVLFIGVKDDGTPEQKTVNLDSVQKTFSEVVSNAYPPIYYSTKILESHGKQFLAVIIPGSEERPHFGGHSFVRVGSQTRKASEKQFIELVTQRSSKAREILKWKDKRITVGFLGPGGETSRREGIVTDCNQFYVTFDNRDSVPLRRVEVSFDSRNNRLMLEIRLV
jgi:predicted HTH transcriptional regulator